MDPTTRSARLACVWMTKLVPRPNNDGVIAIVPGHPEKSALIQRIESTDPDEVMPPPKLHKTIPANQVALLKQWIKEGAKWGQALELRDGGQAGSA